SERVSKLLKKDGVKHNVLNAINHEAEANIIAQAGRHTQVTIATNMAGRGTDILLGGNPEFLARSEMENEWIRRAGSFEGGSKAALAAWEEGGGRTDEAGRELDERRSEYERGLSVMELALLVKGNAGNGAGNGELEELRAEYRAAEDDYVEAERLHEEKRGP